MARRKKVSVPASVVGGKLVFDDRDLFIRQVSELADSQHMQVDVYPLNPKTAEQIRAFHGPVCRQVQEIIRELDGTLHQLDMVKHMLKDRFLPKRKRFFTDGTPVMQRIPHPDQDGAFFMHHLEEMPSLSELTMEEMTEFINNIISHFLNKCNRLITIEEPRTPRVTHPGQ